MAKRYLSHNNGTLQEVEATTVSAGAADAGKIIALDSIGRLDVSFMPLGYNEEANVLPASEDLSAGNYVNIWSDAGVAKVRKADASVAGKEANGFVTEAAEVGEQIKVFKEGKNSQLTGMTPGIRYFLSASTPGGISSSAPTGAGKVVQLLGTSLSATEMVSEPIQPPIVLA